MCKKHQCSTEVALLAIAITIFVLIFLGSIAFMAVSIWVVASPSSFMKSVLNSVGVDSLSSEQYVAIANQILPKSSLLMSHVYVNNALGSLGVINCILGSILISKRIWWIGVAFAVCTFSLILFGTIAGIVKTTQSSEMTTFVTQSFVELQNQTFDGMYNSTQPLSQTWFTVMQVKQCCGVNGPEDFTTNVSSMASNWFKNSRFTCAGSGQCFSNAQVPVSCCELQPNNFEVADSSCPISGVGAFSSDCLTNFITPLFNMFLLYLNFVTYFYYGIGVFALSGGGAGYYGSDFNA